MNSSYQHLPGVDPENSEKGGWDTCPLASYIETPQKGRHGPCRVEHSGDHGKRAYKELRHDSGATNVL
ncbi:unnamed protein product [Porites lobata]|uniref:Prolactin receptor n=1 Tax=Porites lobata TaxID=104759 RepID=A0ABN8R1G2_9CNID|nr:unnamed protein product [Porites lobata]